jgi:hypothetical protein
MLNALAGILFNLVFLALIVSSLVVSGIVDVKFRNGREIKDGQLLDGRDYGDD